MKILAAVDGSPYSKRMLAYLAAHDEWLGAHHEYTLIHAVPAVPSRAAAVLEKETLKAYYDDCAEKVFKPIRTFFATPRSEGQFCDQGRPRRRDRLRVRQEGEVRPAHASARTATAR